MKIQFGSFIVFSSLVLSGSVFAQSPVSSMPKQSAFCSIGLRATSNIVFGNLVSGTGTAHVQVDGSESYTGNIRPGRQTGSHTTAQFLVRGQSGFSYSVASTPASGELTMTDGNGHSLSVQLDAPVALTGVLGTLRPCNSTDDMQMERTEGDPCCGTQTLIIGGTITLNGAQLSGIYSNANAGGTVWTETVMYN